MFEQASRPRSKKSPPALAVAVFPMTFEVHNTSIPIAPLPLAVLP
jgi:hypothetical protein